MYISIIITSYNAETYIIRTLESIFNQTYKFYEVIIVDDGSTDNTKKIVENYIHDHGLDNFRSILLSHVGRVNALNYGIQVAHYDWIAIIDADDLWHRQKLEIQMQYIQKYQLESLGAYSHNFENDNEANLNNNIENQSLTDSILIEHNFNQMLCFNSVSHSTVIMKKNLAFYNRIENHDWDLWLKLLHQGTKLHQLKLYLTYHRIHSKQSFEAKKHIRYVLSSCALQLRYCLLSSKISHIPIVIMRFIYHLLVNRKMRLLLIKYMS